MNTTCRSKHGSSGTPTSTIPKSSIVNMDEDDDDDRTRPDRKRGFANRSTEKPHLSDEMVEVDVNKEDSVDIVYSMEQQQIACSIPSSPSSEPTDIPIKPICEDSSILHSQQLQHNLTLQEFRCSSHCPPKKRALMATAEACISDPFSTSEATFHTDSTPIFTTSLKQSPTTSESDKQMKGTEVFSPIHYTYYEKLESSEYPTDSNNLGKVSLSQSPSSNGHSNNFIETSSENFSTDRDVSMKSRISPLNCVSIPVSSCAPIRNPMATDTTSSGKERPSEDVEIIRSKSNSVTQPTTNNRVSRVPPSNKRCKVTSSLPKGLQSVKHTSRSRAQIISHPFDNIIASKKIACRHIHIAHKICEYSLRKSLTLSTKHPLTLSDISKHLRLDPNIVKPIPLNMTNHHLKRPPVESVSHSWLEKQQEAMDFMHLRNSAPFFACQDRSANAASLNHRLHSSWQLPVQPQDISHSSTSSVSGQQTSSFLSTLTPFSKAPRPISPCRSATDPSATLAMRPLPIKPNLSYSAPASMQPPVEMNSQARQLTPNPINASPLGASMRPHDEHSLYVPKMGNNYDNPYHFLHFNQASKVNLTNESEYRSAWNVVDQAQQKIKEHFQNMPSSLFMEASPQAQAQSIATTPQNYLHRTNEFGRISSSLARPLPCKPVGDPSASSGLSRTGSLFMPPSHYQNPSMFLNPTASVSHPWPHMLSSTIQHKASAHIPTVSSTSVNVVQPIPISANSLNPHSGVIPKYNHPQQAQLQTPQQQHQQQPQQQTAMNTNGSVNSGDIYSHSYLFGKTTYPSMIPAGGPGEVPNYSGTRSTLSSIPHFSMMTAFRGAFPANNPPNFRQLPCQQGQVTTTSRMPWIPSSGMYYNEAPLSSSSIVNHPYAMSLNRFNCPYPTHPFMSHEKEHSFPPNRNTFL